MGGTNHKWRGVFLVGAALSFQFLTPAIPALAQPVVRIGDQQVIDVPTGARVYSQWARARIIQTNLDNALISAVRRGLNPIPVTVTNVNGHSRVQVAGYTIAVADEDTAQAAKKSEQDLAQQWANSIAQALANQDLVKKYTDKLLTEKENAVQASEQYMHIAPAHGPNLRVKFMGEHECSYSASYVGMVGGTAEMAMGAINSSSGQVTQKSERTPPIATPDNK